MHLMQKMTQAINNMIKYKNNSYYMFLKKEKLLLQLQLFLTIFKTKYCVLELWPETLDFETKSDMTSVLWCRLLED